MGSDRGSGEPGSKDSLLHKILIPLGVGVGIAILAGGTSPWWFDELFSDDTTTTSLEVAQVTTTARPEETTTQPDDSTSTTVPSDTSSTLPPEISLAVQHAESVIDTLLANDDVESLVGQLLVASFPGPETYVDELQLPYAEDLFARARVGGVFLSSGNCNFNNGQVLAGREATCAESFGYDPNPNTLDEVATFTADLQKVSFDVAGERGVPFIPLFLAVDHEGDGPPLTHLVNGFHSIPSQMAIGATWEPESAYEVGRAVGSDLSSVGINLLLGPVVDVMREPKPSPTDIGLRTFSSSAELVATMAAHYIDGLKVGSADVEGDGVPRLVSILKHFPGHGGSNENPDNNLSEVLYPEEVGDLGDALLPFGRLSEEAYSRSPNGLMSSHLLYPEMSDCGDGVIFTFGVDCADAFFDYMAASYDGFAEWRDRSLVVTDSLGIQGLRRARPLSYTDNDALCDVAADALKAGHDLLLLGRWSTTDAERDQSTRWSEELKSVQYTTECLARRYREGETYSTDAGVEPLSARLREAATRVLAAKFLLYPELIELPAHDTRGLELVTVSPQRADELAGSRQDDVDQVAARAVTVIDIGGSSSWDGIADTPSKSVLFIECWDDGGRLCPAGGDTLDQGMLEEIAREDIPKKFQSVSSLGLLTAWCASARNYNDAFLASGGDTEVCLESGISESGSSSPQQALADADVIVFGVNATDPDSDVMLAIEDIASSVGSDTRYILIATNRPYFRKRSALAALDLYLATFSKLETSLIGALRIAILGWSTDGVLPVHYPEVFDQAEFESRESEWLAGQDES